MFRAFTTLIGFILCIFPFTSFAGQSLVINRNPMNISVPDPTMPANQSWRVEFQIHDWTPPAAGVYTAAIFQLFGTGAIAKILPDGTLDIETLDQVSKLQPCFVTTGGITNALVRMQKDVANKRFSCEIWNYDGTLYRMDSDTITGLQNRNDSTGNIGAGATVSLGFLRVFTTLVPLGSKPPTTADGGNWSEWKFDGDLKDSSSRRHNGSGPRGLAFVQTPNQVAIANPKTAGAPSWSNWTSLRAGYTAQLDGTASYSLADASSTVSCVWQELNGPSTVVWTNQNSLTPTLNGLVFGTYDFSLQVTDAAGSIATAKLEVGAVATDDNGVVVNADPNVDKIFGPMIAFGKNPWGYADERAITATRLRMAAYTSFGINPPSWATSGSNSNLRATVSYTFNGVGGPAAAPGTVLAKPVSDSSSTTFSIANAALLDLSNLPTRILLGGYGREEIRICAASANKGPATLTACYNGRQEAIPGNPYKVAPQAWPSGTPVGQLKVTGSGTSFLSDLCSSGPGLNGFVTYSAGSIQMTPGSNVVVGLGTAWTNANNVGVGFAVRVSATHGGAPFIFQSRITTLQDPAHMVLVSPYPADADAGSFSYAVIRADFRDIVLHYTRQDKSDGAAAFLTSGCESDTAAYLYSGYDIPVLNGTLQTRKKYSYKDGSGYAGAFGVNFYGEDLAHRALYYRSGWNFALQAARVMSDQYVTSPYIDGGDIGGISLLIGGGVIGGFVAGILDTTDPDRPQWSDLRGLAKNGSIGSLPCNSDDTRDTGYLASWVTLAANYDPDPGQRANWKNQLALIYNRDQRCKGADNSWAHGFLWNNSSAALSLTNGSPIVTGTNIPNSICFGIASGTITVTHDSAFAIGTGLTAGNKIVISGTMNGAPYTGHFQFAINKDGTATLAALWPGDSGAFSFIVENNDFISTIAISNDDPQLKKNWACIWNNPAKITLNRPWDGPTEGNAHLYSYALAGFGQQPYMLGIKLFQMRIASQNDDPVMAANYAALGAQAAQWIHDVGFDPVTQGLHYGRIFAACEPLTTPPPTPLFTMRTPGCNYASDPAATRAARVLTAEASQALRTYYENNPTPAAKTWGDLAYGSIWGFPLYTTGGVYSDSNYVRDENSNGALGAYKWTGFFFGMGMAHQWPAARLGGVQAARNRNVNIDVQQGVAAKVQISVTAPSGAVKIYPCATSSCEVTVDDRQGTHWYRIQQLSEDGKVVSESKPALIESHPRKVTALLPSSSPLLPAASH
jgi:hypothetical protein